MGFSLWLEMGPKGTNNTLAPMGLGLICQLLTSPKLPLIIFNTTIYIYIYTHNCTLGLINKLYPKILMISFDPYMKYP